MEPFPPIAETSTKRVDPRQMGKTTSPNVCRATPGDAGMPCESCGSVNQSKFSGETGIHFPGLKNIDKPVVWVFPELVVCLDCGKAEFAVPEAELRQLVRADVAAEG